MHHEGADQRDSTNNGGSNSESPIGVLVKPEDLASEGHSQGQQEQENTNDPSQLARELVSSKENYLAHVDKHQGTHEVGAPAVHAAQKPSQSDTVIEILQAVPGLRCRGHVNNGQQDAGEDLQNKDRERSAPEDIPPAGRLAGNAVPHRLADRWTDLEPRSKPIADLFQP